MDINDQCPWVGPVGYDSLRQKKNVYALTSRDEIPNQNKLNPVVPGMSRGSTPGQAADRCIINQGIIRTSVHVSVNFSV